MDDVVKLPPRGRARGTSHPRRTYRCRVHASTLIRETAWTVQTRNTSLGADERSRHEAVLRVQPVWQVQGAVAAAPGWVIALAPPGDALPAARRIRLKAVAFRYDALGWGRRTPGRDARDRRLFVMPRRGFLRPLFRLRQWAGAATG